MIILSCLFFVCDCCADGELFAKHCQRGTVEQPQAWPIQQRNPEHAKM